MGSPRLIGITGGIGSGKSTVCKIFEALEVKTYYADDRAKYLMENDAGLVQQVKAIFGNAAYSDGKLNRQTIASQIFLHNKLLEPLNQSVHPAVKNDFTRWVTQNSSQAMLLKEAALLFETGSYKELDYTILVIAEKKVRIERVMKRDQKDKKAIEAIISKQLPESDKKPLADFIIDNNGSHALITQVMDIYARLS